MIALPPGDDPVAFGLATGPLCLRCHRAESNRVSPALAVASRPIRVCARGLGLRSGGVVWHCDGGMDGVRNRWISLEDVCGCDVIESGVAYRGEKISRFPAREVCRPRGDQGSRWGKFCGGLASWPDRHMVSAWEYVVGILCTEY